MHWFFIFLFHWISRYKNIPSIDISIKVLRLVHFALSLTCHIISRLRIDCFVLRPVSNARCFVRSSWRRPRCWEGVEWWRSRVIQLRLYYTITLLQYTIWMMWHECNTITSVFFNYTSTIHNSSEWCRPSVIDLHLHLCKYPPTMHTNVEWWSSCNKITIVFYTIKPPRYETMKLANFEFLQDSVTTKTTSS